MRRRRQPFPAPHSTTFSLTWQGPDESKLQTPSPNIGVVSCSVPLFEHLRWVFSCSNSQHPFIEHETHPCWCVFMLHALFLDPNVNHTHVCAWCPFSMQRGGEALVASFYIILVFHCKLPYVTYDNLRIPTYENFHFGTDSSLFGINLSFCISRVPRNRPGVYNASFIWLCF